MKMKTCFIQAFVLAMLATVVVSSSGSSSSKEKSEGEKCGEVKKNGDFKAKGICEEGTKCMCPEEPNCSRKVKCYCKALTTMAPFTIPTEAPTMASNTTPTEAPTMASNTTLTEAPTMASNTTPTEAPTMASNTTLTEAPTMASNTTPTEAPTMAPYTTTKYEKSSGSSSSKEKSEGEKCGEVKKNGDFKAKGVCEEGTECLCPEDPNCSGKVKCYCKAVTTMGPYTTPTEAPTMASNTTGKKLFK
ncbi:unnamed protein product [Owenia fusiformis]|uniref:Uncharacterized protein n=1 Tax=Owenia fusiformis TaxID=6347 RepID=A0A8S4N6N2_OWEFU|nr:unnamed protein product [Owenia fusiformis]